MLDTQEIKNSKIVKSLIDSGELDLGFCKLLLKKNKGFRGRSYNTAFKTKPFFKVGAVMTKEFKAYLKDL